MSLEKNEAVAGMEQADADANLQKAISLIHPFLMKMILSNPVMKKKLGKKKMDFSQSLQAIIEDWTILYPNKSEFSHSRKYFSRAKKVRNLVAHQSFDCNRYQHDMECLAQVATAIGKPDLAKSILKLVAIEEEEIIPKEENNQVTSVKEDEWASLKQEGNQLYKQGHWREAMNCYTRAIHLNQEEAALYSNRALCEFNLSKFDLAREDIEDAIQLDPKNVKYYRVLSEVLLQMKMHEESLATCLQGLKIDPRDEVLNVRERDCRALIASDATDKNPLFGKSLLGASFEETNEKMMKMLSRYESLHLTSEDIEDCPTFDKLMERSMMSFSIAEAHKYEHGKLSTTPNSQRKAFEIFEAAAKKGSAEGLYNLGRFYSEGKAGLTRDFHKAIELCRKAASQKAFIRFEGTMLPNVGVAEAETFLGNCYRDGRGVEQCATEAFKWYLKAARHECPTAQNNLGHALLNGFGCKQDESSARDWFQKAAEHGVAEAQYNYAMLLEEGRGGPMDVVKAAELLQLSADQGDAVALDRLQKLSRSGALGVSAMERTKENIRKSAEKGDPASLFLLGQNYLNGTGGFEKDLHQAERHFREASKTGYADAYLPLGRLLLELKKNKEAFEFLKLSAEKGSADGQFELGLLYAYGQGCTRDETKARRWFNRAKQQGFSVEETFKGDWIEMKINIGRDTCEYETQQKLTPDQMTIQERTKRFASSKLDANHPATSSYLELLNAFSAGVRTPRTPNVRNMKDINPECMNELMSRAENGSVTAQSFFKACEILRKAANLLERQQTNDAFILYRLSQREWDLPIVEFSYFYSECLKAAKQALDRNSEDADALYALARIDMTQSNEEKLKMVKRCVELDPSVPDFHELLGSMLGFVKDNKNGLRAVDRAIEMLPNHPDWLYTRATLMRLAEDEKGSKNKRYSDDVVEAYLKFMSSNPMDHRKFPEACYSLAQIYALSNEMSKAKTYYQKGLEAEDPDIRLPCFKPIEDNFSPKMITKMLITASESKKGRSSDNKDVHAAQKKTIHNCANCLKSNQSLRCSSCKSVWYCDRVCQVAHWKKHKVDCKRLSAQNN